ncbi:MAG: tetratricopeptide repeat protein [Desulfobacula sp.]|uniref:tetratricopeptide repeat protein n=1 Tax=Desulfobacula sp. TaxID=2593537 RepID=UPI0025BE5214|nr:tetratricopeptide repeat protein [Desulfobacula sp.]MCD4720277.1 tetratricopeptide repeat protein [Desulfobacula sp.]
MSKCGSPSTRSTWIAFILLFFLIILIYSNTFHASWHFDDKPNIVNNYYLHLNNLHPNSLFQTLFTNPKNPWNIGDKMYRPVACLTFALNWYYGKDDVTGYHIVNIVIHILTAYFLYLTIFNLFKSPNLKGKFDGSEHFVALLTAVMWAINPVQTQAVTYIVQRMAILATMFYILGIYFYIKARVIDSLKNRIYFIIGCVFSFIFAMGSKENAAMLPLSLILIEIVFFQNLGSQKTRRRFIGIAAGTISLVLIMGIFFFMKGDSLFFLKEYANRHFTFAERLMTEPRIVIHYLSQIFYSVPNRLSIEHDVLLSTSLIKPWTTLPAILSVFMLIGTGFCLIKKRPLIAFAILFFFLNHVIESTIIPLELIFEHRNYLPSLFLFLPVSAGIKWLIDYYRENRISIYIIIVFFVTLLLTGLGIGTYIRNMAWATELTLWEDAMRKAPGSARPLTVLALEMSQKGDLGNIRHDLALKLYEKSLSHRKSRKNIYPAILNNMAGIYFQKGNSQKAVDLLIRALDIDPNYTKGRFDLIKILITRGRWNDASEHADKLVSITENHEGYLNIKGFILLKQKKSDEAIKYFQKSLRLAPNFKTTLMYMGAALSLSEEYSRADWFLRRANNIPHESIMPLFCLIENSIKAGFFQDAERYTERLLASFSIIAVKDQLIRISHDNLLLPVSSELITEMISKKIMERAKEISELPI